MSLPVVLAVVAIMAVIASTMAAVSMMSLNFTQRWFNASVAMNEAEAGISELLYNVADDSRFGTDGSREIRARLTVGYDDRECGHVVTFRKDADFPYSVNNLDGASPEGYGGRTVPSKMLHLWSTGYCRGMVRTIEALVEKPPFPYALAVSGAIQSRTPLVVEGTRSAADYAAGRKARPGNIAANAPQRDSTDGSRNAIFIRGGAGGIDASTLITGFAQAVGGIHIEDGEVLGGVRPQASKVTLPDIDIAGFRIAGEAGVIALGEGDWPLPKDGKFVLDAMYDREGNLTLNGPVAMRNAFLFVNGRLTIKGSLTGTGAIVSTGDVAIQGDASLDSGNRVALLSGGKVTLNGTGNCFQGLVYSRGGLTVKNITVVGSTIVAGGPATNASLDGVKLVSNSATTSISFTVSSSTKISGNKPAVKTGDFPLPMGSFMANAPPGSPMYVGRPPGVDDDASAWGEGMQINVDSLEKTFLMEPWDANGPPNPVEVGDLYGVPEGGEEVRSAALALAAASQQLVQLATAIKALETAIASMPDTITETVTLPNGSTQTSTKPNEEKNQKKAELAELRARQTAAKDQYKQAAHDLAQAICDFYYGHPSQGLRYNERSDKSIDVHHPFTFDFDRFLSDGARLKVVYWHVYGDKR